jgi:hypothetical protein
MFKLLYKAPAVIDYRGFFNDFFGLMLNNNFPVNVTIPGTNFQKVNTIA